MKHGTVEQNKRRHDTIDELSSEKFSTSYTELRLQGFLPASWLTTVESVFPSANIASRSSRMRSTDPIAFPLKTLFSLLSSPSENCNHSCTVLSSVFQGEAPSSVLLPMCNPALPARHREARACRTMLPLLDHVAILPLVLLLPLLLCSLLLLWGATAIMAACSCRGDCRRRRRRVVPF